MSYKKKRKKIIGVLLWTVLFCGTLLLFHEPLKNFLVSLGITGIGMDKLSSEDIKEGNNKYASFDFDEVQELDLKTILMANLNKKDITIIGGISIPSVNLNLPIGKGTSKYTLALTAGTMKEEQVMGEGNYALAGHHMKRGDLLFSPLYDVEEGAAIYLTDLDYIYEYQIDEKRYIEATDVEVIDDIEGKTIITLITCDDDGEDRFLIRGHFLKKTPIDEVEKEVKNAFKLQVNNK
ncbi:class A sortase [Niallia circulans]|uniref:class A sortase n=1 Tax=Niallia circulans TaxID=1397 RepID=UPI000F44871B|nr:class A sortase [Niallia circulans]AYV70872.1 class A sortase [Niallia circulans]